MNPNHEGGGLREAQQVLRDSVLRQHPEWVTPDGECQPCPLYEHQLAGFAAGLDQESQLETR